MHKPVIVYKKGSRGEVRTEFNSAMEFFELESIKRYNHCYIQENPVYNSVWKNINGTYKYMKSYYLGYDVSIRIIQDVQP